MELTDTQKLQVRLLKFGAVLIFVLLVLFIYLSITIPDANSKPKLEQLDVIAKVHEYLRECGGGDVCQTGYAFTIPEQLHGIASVRIDNDVSCVESTLRVGDAVRLRGTITQIVPEYALILSCATAGTEVVPLDTKTLGSCWQSGNGVRVSYRVTEGKVYCGDQLMRDADAGTFTSIDGALGDEDGIGVAGLAKDKRAIYLASEVFHNGDVKSFQLSGGNYAKDNQRVYYYSNLAGTVRVLMEADPATFQVWTATTDTYVRLFDSMLDPGFAKDKNNYYKEGAVYTGTIPKEVTFQ